MPLKRINGHANLSRPFALVDVERFVQSQYVVILKTETPPRT